MKKNMKESPSMLVNLNGYTIEYAMSGEGIPVLMSHGTLGGYDQGLLLGDAFIGEGYKLVSVSRFGYLRSGFRGVPSYESQADVFERIIDYLKLDTIFLHGSSAGGPPAMQFAIRHPDRCAGLILSSTAAYAPPSEDSARKFPMPHLMYHVIFGYDPIFNMILKLARNSLLKTLGVKKNIPQEEKIWINSFVSSFKPVSKRRVGMKIDRNNIDNIKPYPLEKINAPTLLFNAEDDTIGPIGWGRYTAKSISKSEIVEFNTGGHMLIGHHKAVRKKTREFIKKTAGR